MTKYIFLILLAFVAILAITCAFLIKRLKLEKLKREQAEQERTQAEKAAKFQKEKEKILGEVFDDAKKKNENLHNGSTGERFAAADAILRNK